MKKACGWLLCVFAVMLLAAPAAVAEDDFGEGKKPKARKKRKARGEGRRGQRGRREKANVYAKMAEVLKLEGEAKTKFDEQVAANKKAVKEWKQGDGAKLGELRKSFAEARKAKDKEKIKQLSGEMRTLMLAQRKLEAELLTKLLALLTDEQKAAWAAYQLEKQVAGRFRRCKLTEEQLAQVKTMCAAVAKEIGEAKDGKAKGAAMRKLQTEITEKVLTDEQRETLKKKGGRKPRGEGQGKAKRPKKERGKKKNKPAELGNPAW